MNKAWVRPTSFAPGFTNNRQLSVANYRRATARQQTEVNKICGGLKCQSSWKLLAYILTGSAVVVIFVIIILMAVFFVGGEETIGNIAAAPHPSTVTIVSDLNIANKIQQTTLKHELSSTSTYNAMESTTAAPTVTAITTTPAATTTTPAATTTTTAATTTTTAATTTTTAATTTTTAATTTTTAATTTTTSATTTTTATTTATGTEEITRHAFSISTPESHLSRMTANAIMTSTESAIEQTIVASPTTTSSALVSLVEIGIGSETSSTSSSSSIIPEIQTSSSTTTIAFTSATPNFDNVHIDNTGWNPIPDEAFYTWLASGSSKSKDFSGKSSVSTVGENVMSTTWKSVDDPEATKRIFIGAEVLSQNNNAAKYDNIQLADDILSVFKESTSTVSTSTLENIVKTQFPTSSSTSSSVSSTSREQPVTFGVRPASDLNSATNRQMDSTPIQNTQTEVRPNNRRLL